MQTTTLRKVGGSIMLAVPPAMLLSGDAISNSELEHWRNNTV